jgi:hypothetical protein
MSASNTYESIRARCLNNGQLWEDPDFPTSTKMLAIPPSTTWSPYDVRWLRPKEILRGAIPKFIVQGASRFDVVQGEIGDCWFVVACSCLAVSHEDLFKRCVPNDQDFETNYAGIFRFNFWRFGYWTEVLIDDRLPTVNGRLIYGQNISESNEFWVPLVEKAYAKVNGGYGNLEGGIPCNSLVDLTGGISQTIKIANATDDLFDLMYKMVRKSSLLVGDINSESPNAESYYESKGLGNNHAYSITNVVKLSSRGQTFRLLRIRDPWGNREWNGRWSDKSADWNAITAEVQKEIGRNVALDGEFWMSFEDFMANFTSMSLCHLNPCAIAAELSKKEVTAMWNVTQHEGEWIRGFNAGGPPGSGDYFWKNPQFAIELENPTVQSDHAGHMIISLMQRSYKLSNNIPMSFVIYKVQQGTGMLVEGMNYQEVNPPKERIFMRQREVTAHVEVSPGSYVVIPCTLDRDQSAKFLLRIYTETEVLTQNLDIETTVDMVEKDVDQVADIFKTYSNGDIAMDAVEMTKALADFFRFSKIQFSTEMSRSLMNAITLNDSGVATLDEFRKIVNGVTLWKDKYTAYDRDISGDIDSYELSNVFTSLGLRLNRRVLESVVRRYSGKRRKLNMEDFFLVTSRIIMLYETFKEQPRTQRGTAEFTLDQWLAVTV